MSNNCCWKCGQTLEAGRCPTHGIKQPQGNIPAEAVCFFKDGTAWCCVYGDFINLQESPTGFGDTLEEAFNALIVATRSVSK